jgi:glycerol-3-phosphate acyltransferase PlsY
MQAFQLRLSEPDSLTIAFRRERTAIMFSVLISYLIGSLPSAVLVSRAFSGVDIRDLGDGNMGARNTTRMLGWRAGVIVAALDFGKGALAVLLARHLGADDWIQLLSGLAAVLGHDFPIWARLKGGQGMACSLGVLFILITSPTLLGLGAFALVYLFARNFDMSAGIGLGLIVLLAVLEGFPLPWAAYAASLFVSIGLKTWMDLPRRAMLRQRNTERHS